MATFFRHEISESELKFRGKSDVLDTRIKRPNRVARRSSTQTSLTVRTSPVLVAPFLQTFVMEAMRWMAYKRDEKNPFRGFICIYRQCRGRRA